MQVIFHIFFKIDGNKQSITQKVWQKELTEFLISSKIQLAKIGEVKGA